jgi:hypothetical protein
MTPSILTKINCLQLQRYEKVCLLDVDVVFLRCMDAILEVQTPAGSFRNYWLHCPNLYPSDLQTGDVVPCDPIASSFEEKDGFLVSGSPILLPTGADIFVNLKTPSRAYRRNMKDYRMEIVHWLDEIMITRFLHHTRRRLRIGLCLYT